jgi:hypothetical protein
MPEFPRRWCGRRGSDDEVDERARLDQHVLAGGRGELTEAETERAGGDEGGARLGRGHCCYGYPGMLGEAVMLGRNLQMRPPFLRSVCRSGRCSSLWSGLW